MTNYLNRTKYSLASSSKSSRAEEAVVGKKSSARRRGSDTDAEAPDENASLTYSIASSDNSACSADSSFADIMRVLDLEETNEWKDFMRKERSSLSQDTRGKKSTSGQSVASSLAYSADGESTMLEGSKLLQTISGHSVDGHNFNGSSNVRKEEAFEEDSGLLFAPAEPGRFKKKKKKNNDLLSQRSSSDDSRNPHFDRQSSNSTPRSDKSSFRDASPSPSVDTPTKSPPAERSTPPPRPKRIFHVEDAEKDDEIWYAKWWMFCFPDTAKNLMPKR